jgi:hypothetical protein
VGQLACQEELHSIDLATEVIRITRKEQAVAVAVAMDVEGRN